MKTLIEVKKIDHYVFGKLRTPLKLLFEAQLIIDMELKSNVDWQRRVYDIVKCAGRRSVKLEIEKVHTRLFSIPDKKSFQESIHQIFANK
jgi:hypothetical protein